VTQPEQQLYEVRFTCDNQVRSKMSTNLDLLRDGQRMHSLLIDAMRADRRNNRIGDIGRWRMVIYRPGHLRPVHTYGTTAEPGDEQKLKR